MECANNVCLLNLDGLGEEKIKEMIETELKNDYPARCQSLIDYVLQKESVMYRCMQRAS